MTDSSILHLIPKISYKEKGEEGKTRGKGRKREDENGKKAKVRVEEIERRDGACVGGGERGSEKGKGIRKEREEREGGRRKEEKGKERQNKVIVLVEGGGKDRCRWRGELVDGGNLRVEEAILKTSIKVRTPYHHSNNKLVKRQ